MEFRNNISELDESLQRELISIAKKSKFKKRIFIFTLILLTGMVLVTAAWIYGKNKETEKAKAEIAELKEEIAEQKKQIEKLNDEPIVANAVAPRINMEIIHSEIGSIGELATTEYLFTDAAEFSDSKQIKNWNIPLTEKSFFLRWSGVIKAGVELDKVKLEVDEPAKKIIVSIPKAIILSYTVDKDSVEVLNEKDNIFNNITIDDKVKFDAKTEEAVVQRAIENGLLEKALKNAEDIILRLILADPVAHDSYTVEFITLE